MTITVNSAASSEFTAAACFLYNLPWGNIVTTSGDYVHTYQTINGCDSIVTAHITINNEPNVTTNATVCVSQLPFVWNGNSYNAPGTYSLNLQNATGCNFIATLILKVNTITRSTTNTTICRVNYHSHGTAILILLPALILSHYKMWQVVILLQN
jgi:hypothetical protein